jgi:hypothetical protein
MRRAVLLAAVLVLALAAAAPPPLVGNWRLERQEINGVAANAEPLALKVSEAGDKLAFAFSVPVNNVYFVSMSYTLRLDGTEADVKNAQGEKIGTIQMTASGPSQYKLSLKGPHRPDSSGTLTVSADGKSLTSEADTTQAGQTVHSKQLYSRY